MKNIFFLIPFFLISLWLPVACQKTYTLPTVPPTPGPTATPTCNTPAQTQPCSGTGIQWGYGQVVVQASQGGTTTWYAELEIDVDCALCTNAQVTLTSPELALPVPVPYANGHVLMNGTQYSDYGTNNFPGTLAAGSYTLTAVTPSGTTSATLTLPPQPVISADGSTASWPGSAQWALVAVDNSSYSRTFISSDCWSASSPYSIPASAYPSSGTYYAPRVVKIGRRPLTGVPAFSAYPTHTKRA